MPNIMSENRGPVQIITLNRPDQLNALTLELLHELLATVARARQDGIRAVVLTGTGRGFCAGADLAEWADPPVETDTSRSDSPGGPRRSVLRTEYWTETVQQLVRELWELPVPIVAAINGSTAGGGVDLAMACDFRLAVESARFYPGYAAVGIGPDVGGSWLLPRLVGAERAKLFYLATKFWTAEQALSYGLIGEVCPASATALMDRALALADQLASLPRLTVSCTKRLIQRAASVSLSDAQAAELDCSRFLGLTPDTIEAGNAFAEKRPARLTHNLR
jgi:2-(1,2-epoxy-1,2-dihydrophenyl)acetyl-CoA isomerase